MKRVSILLGLAGLLAATVLVGWSGFGGVLHSVLSVGWPGFLGYMAWYFGMLVGLAVAWMVLAPDWARLGLYVGARMVRDAAAQLLPFAQVGGVLLGARVVTNGGVPWPEAVAVVIVDLTTEFLAQLAFSMLGLAVLLRADPGSHLILPLAGALAVALVGAVAFLVLQHGAGGLLRRLTDRIAQPWLGGLSGRVDRVQAELDAQYRRPGRVLLSAVLHLGCWLGTAGASWIAFRLVGAPLGYAEALAVELLLHVGLTATFVVPGAIGVQEGLYVALGALFGVPADLALAASLLRRARDIAFGVPVLLIWQASEARRLRRA